MTDLAAELREVGVEAFTSRGYRRRTVRHIVLFRYRSEVTPAQRAEVARRFEALAAAPRDGAPYIESIVSGEQGSGEGAGHGFERAFVVTFSSEGDRNYYVGEPVHDDPDHLDAAHAEFKAFVGRLLQPGADGVLVFDF
jgi:hypothetical protein